jgi:hypothetical protein
MVIMSLYSPSSNNLALIPESLRERFNMIHIQTDCPLTRNVSGASVWSVVSGSDDKLHGSPFWGPGNLPAGIAQIWRKAECDGATLAIDGFKSARPSFVYPRTGEPMKSSLLASRRPPKPFGDINHSEGVICLNLLMK